MIANKDKLLRLFDKAVMHFQRETLPPPGEFELALGNQFRTKLQSITIDTTQSLPPAQRAWNINMRKLQQLAETQDPRRFLRWEVVGGTMFVKYAKYSRTEYRYLRSLGNWSRWKHALREDETGSPPRCPFDTATSCNLIHHAYHVARFESLSDLTIDNFDVVFEFGGGYGSMCRLFFRLGFNGRYLILDLPAFSALQEYFLKSIGIRILTEDEFLEGHSGALCVSDIDKLDNLLGAKKSLFLATWSISESPLSVREKVLGKHSNSFDAYLLAFQPKFEDIDNVAFFESLRASLPAYSWVMENMAHLPYQRYLFGKRVHE